MHFLGHFDKEKFSAYTSNFATRIIMSFIISPCSINYYSPYLCYNPTWGYVHNKKFLWFNLIAFFGLVVYVMATDYKNR